VRSGTEPGTGCPRYRSTVARAGGGGQRPRHRSARDGRSPFHFAAPLALVEAAAPAHLDVLVPAGEPCPTVGDAVDVQRPLTATRADRVVER